MRRSGAVWLMLAAIAATTIVEQSFLHEALEELR